MPIQSPPIIDPNPIDAEQVTIEFTRRREIFEGLEREAVFTLKSKLAGSGIQLHSIQHRVKSIDSLLEKANRFRLQDPLHRINDIVGVRVICLFLSDIERIGKVIRDTFTVVREDNKIGDSPLSSFGYLSVHFIVKLGEGFSGTRYEHISDLPFEIQVRTIAMDAWANISHYLDYKTDQDIPQELKRDFYALSGMFYVADKHFQLFFEQRAKESFNLEKEFEGANSEARFEQPLNLDTLTAYIKAKFPSRGTGTSELISDSVSVLRDAGYTTIEQLNAPLGEHSDEGSTVEWRQYTGGERFNGIGVLMELMRAADPNVDAAMWKAVLRKSFPDKSASELAEMAQKYSGFVKDMVPHFSQGEDVSTD